MKKCYVIGGANIDIIAKASNQLIEFDSNPGHINLAFGGVARNIAENIVKHGVKVGFKSLFSSDLLGQLLYEKCLKDFDLQYSRIIKEKNTSCYVAVLNQKNDMQLAISDMEILDSLSDVEILEFIKIVKKDEWLVIDGNLKQAHIDLIFENKAFNIAVDPISINKCYKFKKHLSKIDLIKPNYYEAKAILDDDNLTNIEMLKKFKNYGVGKIFISMGEMGVLYFENDCPFQMMVKDKVDVKNATGAGDAFLGSIMASIINGENDEQMLKKATASSIMTLECDNSVCQNINEKTVKIQMEKLTYIKEKL